MSEAIFTDCKVVWREVVPGQPVQSHKHKKGHITVINGDVIMKIHDELGNVTRAERVTNRWIYIPADMVHSIEALCFTRMYCAGREDF